MIRTSPPGPLRSQQPLSSSGKAVKPLLVVNSRRSSSTHLGLAVLAMVVLWLAIALVRLMGEPVPLVADNGDFWRVARPAGLEQLEGAVLDGRHPARSFGVAASGAPGASSASLLAMVARLGGAERERFDVRWFGGVLWVVLTLAAILAWGGRAYLPLVVGLVALCDAAYLPFFNSFYADATYFVGFVALVWALWVGFGREQWTLASLAAAGLAVGLAGGSKMLFSALGLVAAGVAGAVAVVTACRSRRDWVAAVVLGSVGLASVLWFAVGPGPNFAVVNRYHTVFAGFATVSSEPEAGLERLGLAAFVSLPRQDVFRAGIGSDHPVHAALESVSRWDLLRAYARDLPAMGRVAQLVGAELAASHSHTRFTREGQRRGPPYELVATDFSYWRTTLLGKRPWPIWGLVAVSVLAATILAWRRPDRSALGVLLFLQAWLVFQVVAVVLGDGLVSLRQHLLGARLALDLLWLLSAALVMVAVAGRLRSWSAPRGS